MKYDKSISRPVRSGHNYPATVILILLSFYLISLEIRLTKSGRESNTKSLHGLPVFIKVNVKTGGAGGCYYRWNTFGNLKKNIEAARRLPVLLSQGFMGLT